MTNKVKLTPWQLRVLRVASHNKPRVTNGQIFWRDQGGFNVNVLDIPSDHQFQDLGNMGLLTRDDQNMLTITDLGREAIKPKPEAQADSSELTDLQLDLLSRIAGRKHGFAAELEPHLKTESAEAFKVLVKRQLLERSGNTYFATPQAHILLEGIPL